MGLCLFMYFTDLKKKKNERKGQMKSRKHKARKIRHGKENVINEKHGNDIVDMKLCDEFNRYKYN